MPCLPIDGSRGGTFVGLGSGILAPKMSFANAAEVGRSGRAQARCRSRCSSSRRRASPETSCKRLRCWAKSTCERGALPLSMDGTALLPLSSHAAKCKSGKLLDWATVITSDFIGGEIRGQATRRDRGASAIVVRRALGQHRAETTWREAAAQQPVQRVVQSRDTHGYRYSTNHEDTSTRKVPGIALESLICDCVGQLPFLGPREERRDENVFLGRLTRRRTRSRETEFLNAYWASLERCPMRLRRCCFLLLS